jgi:hypothetical protein
MVGWKANIVFRNFENERGKSTCEKQKKEKMGNNRKKSWKEKMGNNRNKKLKN